MRTTAKQYTDVRQHTLRWNRQRIEFLPRLDKVINTLVGLILFFGKVHFSAP